MSFKSESLFSSVLVYPRFAVVGQVYMHDAKKSWFLLFMFLPLPLAIWLSLVLAVLAVSDCDLSLLQACVSVLLGDQFSPGGIWVWRAVGQGHLHGIDKIQKDPFPGYSCFLCPDALGGSLLGEEFEQKWWSYLCSQVFQHS